MWQESRAITRRAEQTRARLAEIAHSDDPRVAAIVTSIIAQPPFGCSAGARPFWKLVFDTAMRLCDPRLLARRDELIATFAERFPGRGHGKDDMRRKLARLIAHVEAAYPDGPPPEAPMPTFAKPVLREPTELLAEIAANVDDDGPRGVYADVLVERQDPRGEFIALQLTNREPRRQRALLDEHVTAWLGPLAAVVPKAGAGFDRGFLAEATIRIGGASLKRVARDPRWATVERIRSSFPGVAGILVERGTFPALRELDALLFERDLRHLDATRLPRLATISIESGDLTAAIVASLVAMPKLPSLRVLRLHTWNPMTARAALEAADRIAPIVVFVDLANGTEPVPPLEQR